MHRVELKVNFSLCSSSINTTVPNAPCGVESNLGLKDVHPPTPPFLMHRVELKAAYSPSSSLPSFTAPNVPYGVERTAKLQKTHPPEVFLMYRMELKGMWEGDILLVFLRFLMYRVDLEDDGKLLRFYRKRD